MIDLATASNAPREIALDGATYRARTLTLNQFGELLAWLDGRLAGEAPLPFASVAAQVALATTEGLAVVLHLCLSSCHPELTRDRAKSLAATLDEGGAARVLAVALRRRPRRKLPREGRGKDLTEVDWGPVWEALSQHQAGLYAACGDITLDQMDMFLGKGETEDEGDLSPQEFYRMWEEEDGVGDAADALAPDPDAVLLPGESATSPEATDDGG